MTMEEDTNEPGDRLVRLLNSFGYQPIFARDGLVPPSLFTFERSTKGYALRLRGDLRKYCPNSAHFYARPSKLSTELSGCTTSSKDLRASVKFLERLLACIGITTVPKLNLGFAKSSKLSFSLSGLTTKGVQPADIEPHLDEIMFDRLPPDLLQDGKVWVAYEYLYVSRVVIGREDRRAFHFEGQAKLSEYLDFGGSAEAELTTEGKIVVEPTQPSEIACAARAARVQETDGRRYLRIESNEPPRPVRPGDSILMDELLSVARSRKRTASYDLQKKHSGVPGSGSAEPTRPDLAADQPSQEPEVEDPPVEPHSKSASVPFPNGVVMVLESQ